MKKILFITTILLIGSNCFAQQKTHLTNIINIAAKQRMLVQRLAKDKTYITIKERKDQAKNEMEITFRSFENGISTLKSFSPNKEIVHKIGLVEFSYDVYKKMILNKSKESLTDVVKYNTLFLNTCDDLLSELLTFSKNVASKNTDKQEAYIFSNISNATAASGKLRYLTQRLNLYVALNSTKNNKITSNQIDLIIKDIDRSLNYLTVLEFNTLEIDDSLSELLYSFSNLKKEIHSPLINQKETINQLFEKCNNVLQKANTTTNLYVDLGKKYQFSTVADR